MVTESEAGNIIYRDCRKFGVSVFQGFLKSERPKETEWISITPKPVTKGRIWDKCYIEVNWMIPDKAGLADLTRLHTIERLLIKGLESFGGYDGNPYRYEVESTQIIEAESYKSHYVNARVLFKSMNITE